MAEGTGCEAPKACTAKIVMVGDSFVGKTSVLRRYTDLCPTARGLPPSYITTVGFHQQKLHGPVFKDNTLNILIVIAEEGKVVDKHCLELSDLKVLQTNSQLEFKNSCLELESKVLNTKCHAIGLLSTIGDTTGIDFKVKTISCDNTTMKLQIWDTAGQERFHTFTTNFFRGAHGFVLVYDITDAKSFQGISHWMKDIYEKVGENTDIILLGNKCDKEAERVISKNRGEKLAWEYGIPFFETSAKDNINIENAFSVLAKEILNKNSCVLLDLDVVDLNEKLQTRSCCKL